MEEMVQRQMAILKRLADGEKQRTISDELGISSQAFSNFVTTLQTIAGAEGRLSLWHMVWDWEQKQRRKVAV